MEKENILEHADSIFWGQNVLLPDYKASHAAPLWDPNIHCGTTAIPLYYSCQYNPGSSLAPGLKKIKNWKKVWNIPNIATVNWFFTNVILLSYWDSQLLGNLFKYEGDSVNRSQMDIKHVIFITGKNIYFSTYPPLTLIHLSHRIQVHWNLHHRSL
jgi:hypothetical protein